MLYNANHSGLLLTQSSKRSYFNDLYKSLGKEAEITYIKTIITTELSVKLHVPIRRHSIRIKQLATLNKHTALLCIKKTSHKEDNADAN